MTEGINLTEYSYPNGVATEIPGTLLEALIQILDEVDKKETTNGFIDSYPKSQKEITRDQDGEQFLEAVEVEWAKYSSAESYFSQTPQEIKSMLGCMALDLSLLLKKVHLVNIENGLAVKRGTFKKEEEDVKLS